MNADDRRELIEKMFVASIVLKQAAVGLSEDTFKEQPTLDVNGELAWKTDFADGLAAALYVQQILKDRSI